MYYIPKNELENDIRYISRKLKYYDYKFIMEDKFTDFVTCEDGFYEVDEFDFDNSKNPIAFAGRNKNNAVQITFTPPNKFHFTDFTNISVEFFEINGIDYYLNAINKKSLKWVLTGRY